MPERFTLLIDARDRSVAYVGLAHGRKVVRTVRIPVLGATHRILSAVRRLAKNKASVSGVVVARGPGSFTAVRMGVVVANAVAFGLGVPISGVRISAEVLPSRRSLTLLAAVSPRRRGLVLPVYDRPPSITKQKH